MPPLVGVAVKVTEFPVHMEVAVAEMLTLAVTIGLIVTPRFAEDGPLPQPLALVPATETFPLAVPKVTVILFVLAPEVMLAPAGRLQT